MGVEGDHPRRLPLRSNEHYNACLFDVKQYDAELALFRIFYVLTPAACCRAYVKRQLRIFRLAAQAIKPELRLLHFGLRRCVAANQGNGVLSIYEQNIEPNKVERRFAPRKGLLEMADVVETTSLEVSGTI
ncbi:MAG TPA: hypothetical protein VJ747_02610, partial [Stellaceae bacterium]|nr:hypothetical protein [Stellaceae bacterium]